MKQMDGRLWKAEASTGESCRYTGELWRTGGIGKARRSKVFGRDADADLRASSTYILLTVVFLFVELTIVKHS